jgi:glyoxylate utilization-related uncharacterized protein
MYMHNIEKITKNNEELNHVVYTASHSQLILHSIPKGKNVGNNKNNYGDRIIMLVEGTCDGIIDGEKQTLQSKDVLYVPAGAQHTIVNTGQKSAKLFTLSTPDKQDVYEFVEEA